MVMAGAAAAKKVDKKWFRDQLEAKELSQRQLAKKLGIEPSAITLFLAGRRGLKNDEAVAISKILGVRLDDVLAAAGVAVPESVRIVGAVDGDFKIAWGAPKSGPKAADWPGGGGQAVEALRIESVGSKAEGLDGGLIYFAAGAGVDANSLGRLAVVTTKGGKNAVSAVRTVKRGYSAGRFNLFSMNGELRESDVELDSARLVVWMRL